MMMSMTGFGSAKAQINDHELSIVIKTVNHKHCDVRLNLPSHYISFETEIKKRISNKLFRGRIEVFIESKIINGTNLSYNLNKPVLQGLISLLKLVQVETGDNRGYLPLEVLMQFKNEIFTSVTREYDKEYLNSFYKLLNEAISEVLIMRKEEGKNLDKFILSSLTSLETNIKKLVEIKEQVGDNYYKMLIKRINTKLKDVPVSSDDPQLLKELALFAERSDITEELVRLDSHIMQFKNIIKHEGTIGKKLDFLVQEMMRETNTIGAKANSADISVLVINLKSEIEKIREQIQNIM